MIGKLSKHRKIWKTKTILREIYHNWYKKIVEDFYHSKKKSLEIGSGIGSFKEYNPSIISSDIDKQEWLDMVFDAERMPFKRKSIANIVLIDVLHHIANPLSFIEEASRVLEKNGRLIMLEPYPSFFSLIVYRLYHPEPFNFDVNYFNAQVDSKDKDPWDSNQAIPYILFFKEIKKFDKIFNTRFRVIKKEKLSFLLYPLSGGFENQQMIPDLLIPFVKILEIILKPFRSLIAFRCYIVLEKI